MSIHTTAHASSRGRNVSIYNGFQEKTTRLLYLYSNYKELKSGVTVTVLPDGTIENPLSNLKFEDGKALTTYPFPQTLDVMPSYFDQDEVINNRVDLVSWKRPDGTLALSQSWKQNVNESYLDMIKLDPVNPDPSMFSEEAVDEFKYSLQKLFNVSHLPGVVYYATAKESKTNSYPVLVGTGSNILQMISSYEPFQPFLRGLTRDGFSTIQYKKKEPLRDDEGNLKLQTFHLSPTLKYAVYVKTGWTDMLVPTPFHQFVMGRTKMDGSRFE